MVSGLLYVHTSLFSKIAQCYSSTEGVLGFLGCLAFNYFIGYEGMILFVILCVIIDGIFGIVSATKRGVYTTSTLMRQSLNKILVYIVVIILLIGIERLFDISSTFPVAAVVSLISLCELWSISASCLIINPRIPVLRLFQKILVGEIAMKLGITKDEVDNALMCGSYVKKYTDVDQKGATKKYSKKK